MSIEMLSASGALQLTDEQVVQRVLQGDTGLYEVIMRRHNQRLYRTIRAILGNEDDVEDLMQEVYLQAYRRLSQFRGESAFLTWLTSIAIRRALTHRRRLRDNHEQLETEQEMTSRPDDRSSGPERQAFDFELRKILESAIDSMPARYRAVLILRDVQGLSTSETAQCLHMTVEAAKVALHRARRKIRGLITRQVGGSFEQLFPFHAPRCNAVVEGVLRRLTAREN